MIRGVEGADAVTSATPPVEGEPVDRSATVRTYLDRTSFVTVAVDRRCGDRLIPSSITGTPDAVSNILSTIASAMVTLTTLVLTVTTVAVQLAMGQFSPRIVRALLQDRAGQLAYGLFASTFTFAILALREVGAVGGGTVPGLPADAGQHRCAVPLHQSRRQLPACCRADRPRRGSPARAAEPALSAAAPRPAPRDMVVAPEPGIVTDLDHPGLVEAARDADCMLEMVPMMGDFVPAGAPLFRVHGDPGRLVHERVAGLVILAAERTHGDDPAYGFRKLVDIAERGLAQPFTDPTTAVMVIDRLHDCLRQLATRDFPSGRHHDAGGDVRFIERTMTWEGYVRLAFDELHLAGGCLAPNCSSDTGRTGGSQGRRAIGAASAARPSAGPAYRSGQTRVRQRR